MYEPMDTLQDQAPPMQPQMISRDNEIPRPGQGPLPGQIPHQLGARPPVNGNNNVAVPKTPTTPSKWEDISEYENIQDWVYIFVGVLIVEVIVIVLTRSFPEIFGKSLNIWYNRFKLSAVLADVLIIMVGIGIARYVYTEYVYPTYDWNPIYFTATTVVIQLVHDLLFYFGIIRQLPAGNNAMMDVMRDYGEGGGVKILASDSAMMIGSSLAAMLLKAAPAHITLSIGLLTLYVVPYILETRNMFSGIS